jgi:hypothetical protein
VHINGHAPQFANTDLRDNEKNVGKSVQRNGRGRALPFASERLQNNEDIVKAKSSKKYDKMVEHYNVQWQWPLSN